MYFVTMYLVSMAIMQWGEISEGVHSTFHVFLIFTLVAQT